DFGRSLFMVATPTGYAATNNPLQQYHYTLKLVNGSKRANPVELVVRLDLLRIAHILSLQPFRDQPTVSKRFLFPFGRVDNKKNIVHIRPQCRPCHHL
ncbi:hypothetical protein F444_07168, partial [Phytophthora nicotianae P1976]